jgi:hypothetical protein
MAGNKKPRKKYRPKPVLIEPHMHAVERVLPVEQQNSEWLTERKIKLSSALTEIMQGRGSSDHFTELVRHHNMAYSLVVTGIAKPYTWVCSESKQALQSIAERHQRLSVYGVSAEDIQSFQTLVEFFNQLMGVVTIGAVEDAMAKARHMYNTGADFDKLAPHFYLMEER